MNKPKMVAKQKRVGEGSKSTTPKALQVAKPGWKAFYDNAKKKLFTGSVTNTAIWSAIVVAVTMFVTFGAYRSLNRFRDTRFEQMEHELNDLRARREELAQQNPRERFVEAAEMEKQHAEALRDILETVRRSPGSAEVLLHPGTEGDSDLALASLEDIQASQARIERVREKTSQQPNVHICWQARMFLLILDFFRTLIVDARMQFEKLFVVELGKQPEHPSDASKVKSLSKWEMVHRAVHAKANCLHCHWDTVVHVYSFIISTFNVGFE
ncbi:UNVERIFIED_CONTAM: hypothetical protein HHA_279350 [Hammondia hammondi]|eukprot:XP_008887718.1 hypothetical protein HHA_279350 [Hammondia hammondi]